ncbi:sensor histidine kinase [Salinibacter altiplanensis]|uniref:sensor histidine kinase n=1 Tax=Salinibacter altiplanensis TaxID=1803181 RepID=UPI000C9FA2C6|nr:HAMP domain-containing sensor histidine kinase [Salinibacter altiplanensis]
MIELTGQSSPSVERSSPSRPSFRRRLLTVVGPALGGALLLLALLAWGAVYVALQQGAVDVLQAEGIEVTADIEYNERGNLEVDGHGWEEVHHRLADKRVDPVFVQVFDRYNRIVRASANIDSLSARYPEQPRASPRSSAWMPTLQTFETGGRTLYYLVRPITRDGQAVGYVQVARLLPKYSPVLQRYGAGLALVVVLLFGGLLALVGWAAGRVLRPLRRITAFAETTTSSDLGDRIDVPETADHETALLARTINDLLDRLEESFEALRTFTSNAAHELQTPLTVLQGHVEIALRRSRSAESYESTLHLLDRRLGEMVRTVRSLLTLTRLDQGEELSTEPVDLGVLACEEGEAAQSRAEDKGITVTMNTDEVWVDGQPDLLREAVQNLVDNAVKYTEDGEVRVSVTEEEGQAALRCRDTGMGIKAEDLPHVGARFYRSQEAGTADSEGSGLGLALVRRIVEAHDGELRVESIPGEGSQFELSLPAVPAPASAQAVDAS